MKKQKKYAISAIEKVSEKSKYPVHVMISKSSKIKYRQLYFLIKKSLLQTLRNIFLSLTIETPQMKGSKLIIFLTKKNPKKSVLVKKN